MPYINCVNMSTQSELLEILPILVSDLYEGKLDTLDKFSVKWTHVNVIYHEPDTELENYMIKDFTVAVPLVFTSIAIASTSSFEILLSA